ncbi:MAG: helix-turn-helix transcriptional regulator [Deltaproteobacteria bacterium]|nr:helix-turn-helix transcriptional regulator [Deltaproteobacteria bacterium]
MDDLPKLFGARLRELRHRAGLTQQALGEKSSVDYKFVGGIERRIQNPSLAILGKLAIGLDVELKELFELEHLEADRIVRTKAKKAIDAASPEDAARILRVVRAITS